MACRLVDAKPLTEPMMEYCQLDPWQKYWNSYTYIKENALENVV